MMTGADKVICQAAAVLLLFTVTCAPAKAQFAGFGGGDIMGMIGGGGGGGDIMSMIGPMMRMANFGGGGHRHHRRR
jgi:hypothetical protein